MAKLKKLYRVVGCVVRNWKVFSYGVKASFKEAAYIVDLAITLEDELKGV